MDMLKFLLMRCKRNAGKTTFFILFGYIILYGARLILTSIFPGIFIDAILISENIAILLSLLITQMICTYFGGVTKRKAELLFFNFRLNEIGNTQSACINVPPDFAESNAGQTQIQEALQSVCSGNDYGIEAYLRAIVELFMLSFALSGYIFFMTRLPLWFNLLCVFCIILKIPSEKKYRKIDQQNTQAFFATYRKLDEFRRCMLQEDFAKDVRLFNGVPFFSHKLSQKTDSLISLNVAKEKQKTHRTLIHAIANLARNICLVVLFCRYDGITSIGNVVLYIGVLSGIDQIVAELWEAAGEIRNNTEPTKKFCQFIQQYEKKDAAKSHPQKPDIRPDSPAIKFSNVSFSYGEQQILNDISFEIMQHEKIALVGENGVGKTTLIKLLLGIVHPDNGSILINGLEMTPANREQIWNNISASFQEAPILSFSLQENITGSSMDEINLLRFNDTLRRADLTNMVNQLPQKEQTILGSDYSEDGIGLSGGERQKVLMARMLYKTANIALLDEPTAALDAKAESKVYETHRVATNNMTCIFVSHRLGSTAFCDRIFFLENSSTIHIDSFENLYNNCERFRMMYDSQRQYYKEDEL